MTSTNDPFSFSGNYYDLFYQDKNYRKEADHIINIIRSLKPDAKQLLELGCGSGNYSLHFSNSNFFITGVDLSEGMLERAREKQIENFDSLKSDISNFQISKQFDVCVALFDVVSYLTESENILCCFANVYKHLTPGGLFILDVWNTSGVCSDPPVGNQKIVILNGNKIIRNSESELNFKSNIVTVKHTYLFFDNNDNLTNTNCEIHKMRHFSVQEIVYFAKINGFSLIKVEEPFGNDDFTAKSWKACYTFKK